VKKKGKAAVIRQRWSCVPRWVTRQISGLRQIGRIDPYYEVHRCAVSIRMLAQELDDKHEFSRLMDHWGSCGDVFYCEPYWTKVEVKPIADRLSRLLCCSWRFAKPRWNDSTIRVEFYRSPEDQLPLSGLRRQQVFADIVSPAIEAKIKAYMDTPYRKHKRLEDLRVITTTKVWVRVRKMLGVPMF